MDLDASGAPCNFQLANNCRPNWGCKCILRVLADSRVQRRETSRAVQRSRRDGRVWGRGRAVLATQAEKNKRKRTSTRVDRDRRRAVFPENRQTVRSRSVTLENRREFLSNEFTTRLKIVSLNFAKRGKQTSACRNKCVLLLVPWSYDFPSVTKRTATWKSASQYFRYYVIFRILCSAFSLEHDGLVAFLGYARDGRCSDMSFALLNYTVFAVAAEHYKVADPLLYRLIWV